MSYPSHSAEAKLLAWQTAQAELVQVERLLGDAMVEYAQTRGSPPRELIIAAERMRDKTRELFEIAMEALDAQSLARTGHTNFGELR